MGAPKSAVRHDCINGEILIFSGYRTWLASSRIRQEEISYSSFGDVSETVTGRYRLPALEQLPLSWRAHDCAVNERKRRIDADIDFSCVVISLALSHGW